MFLRTQFLREDSLNSEFLSFLFWPTDKLFGEGTKSFNSDRLAKKNILKLIDKLPRH